MAWIDRARGVALVAMIAFHFSFDLRFLGFTDWPVSTAPGWRLFAASIAGSFIALAGISLQMAHGDGIRWRAFGTRLAILASAAALVTLGTWAAMPAPVTFGILHAIATFSVLALAFLRVPVWGLLIAACLVWQAPAYLTSEAFAHPLLYPLGLSPTSPFSFDYEPIFPWFAPMLVGLALARLLPAPRRPVATDPLARLGRHSLLVYLLHQPILMGVLMGVRWLTA